MSADKAAPFIPGSTLQRATSPAIGLAAASADGAAATPEFATLAAERVASRISTKSTLPPRAEEHPPLSTARTIGIIVVATAAMSLSGAGTMSLSIALPAIMEDLSVPESQLQWISSAFSLTNGCFLLLAGRLADV